MPPSSPAALRASAPPPREMLAAAGAKVAILDVNDDGRQCRARTKIRRMALHCDVTSADGTAKAIATAAGQARRRAHPDQLRRRRAGQAHRRPRRPDAARRFQPRHLDQPDRHLQRDAAGRRRHAGCRAACKTASAASSSAPRRSPPTRARSARPPMRHRKAAWSDWSCRRRANSRSSASASPASRPAFSPRRCCTRCPKPRSRASRRRCRSRNCSAQPPQYAALVRHMIENRYLNGEVVRLDGALRMAPR